MRQPAPAVYPAIATPTAISRLTFSPQPPSDQRYEEVCDAIDDDNPRGCALTSDDGVAELQQSVCSEKEDQDRDNARRNKRGTHEEE